MCGRRSSLWGTLVSPQRRSHLRSNVTHRLDLVFQTFCFLMENGSYGCFLKKQILIYVLLPFELDRVKSVLKFSFDSFTVRCSLNLIIRFGGPWLDWVLSGVTLNRFNLVKFFWENVRWIIFMK